MFHSTTSITPPPRAVATAPATLAVCTAPGRGGHPARVLDRPALVSRGKGTNTRHIHNIAMEDSDVADSLLVTEVFTPDGHWSSYPPHRHDEDDFPRMTYLEETYYHRLRPSQGFAFVNALVLAKVMLVAEDLNLGNWLQGRPLLWPVLHESVLFALLFIAVHYLEHILIGLLHHETLQASVPAIGGGGLPGLLSTAVIMAVALIPFFAFRDVNRALGGNRLVELVLGRRGGQTASRS